MGACVLLGLGVVVGWWSEMECTTPAVAWRAMLESRLNDGHRHTRALTQVFGGGAVPEAGRGPAAGLCQGVDMISS